MSVRDRGRRQAAQNKMAFFVKRSVIGAVATAGLVALAVTAYGNTASGKTSGANDPTSPSLFEKAAVGGRTGCEVQSWPYIAPSCLIGSDAKPARRV